MCTQTTLSLLYTIRLTPDSSQGVFPGTLIAEAQETIF